MFLKANGIGVDSGMIIVADKSYFSKTRDSFKDVKKMGKVLEIPKGKYKVEYIIPLDDDGDSDTRICEGVETLEVTTGEIVVIDPCYVIGEKSGDGWMKWLNETEYGSDINSSKAFGIDSMGGDGCYEVHLNFVEIKNV